MLVSGNIRTNHFRPLLRCPRHVGVHWGSECEVTVITFIERFNENIAGGSQSCSYPGVIDPRSARHVDGLAPQMITVGYSADLTIVRHGSKGAGDDTIRCEDPLGGKGHVVERADCAILR